MNRASGIGLLLAGSACMPGCIVWDIKDELVGANEQLLAIDGSFQLVEETNQKLTALEQRLVVLDSINDNLTSIDAKLAAIDEKLGPVGERLATIDAELEKVGVHLASLRKTINNIDSTIPFLSISGDSDEDKETLEEGTPAEPPQESDPATQPK
ncbi:MAG: hypothetical protein ACIAQF_02725 [Phycisphaerales bacterium JB065]